MNSAVELRALDDLSFEDHRVGLINYVTRTYFGYGAMAYLPEELRRNGICRPLIVTDKGVLALNQIQGLLNEVPHAVVFDGTPANPTEFAARAGAAVFNTHACDGLIAVGGGSPMDLAKAIGLLASHSGPLQQYAIVNGGIERIQATVPPVIAVPTTAGTGSEVARAAVLILEDGTKKAIASPHLIPRAAICDPANTIGMPRWLTAATGFDAIAHCLEAYCSPQINPPADAIALDGLRRALSCLERAVSDSEDRQARWHMLMASLQGGLTFQKGLGAIHALSHPLGAFGFHHGTLNAILLPHVLAFNALHLQGKLDRLAACVGLERSVDVPHLFAELIQRVGIPSTLTELGFETQHIATVAHNAVMDSCNATNPRTMTAEEYGLVLRAAM